MIGECRIGMFACAALPFFFALQPVSAWAQQPLPVERWEPQIAAFEAEDRQQPPPRDAVLFVGSSSIRRWDLPASFPDLPVINRGFGGSQVSDSLHYADRIILPYAPRVVVIYAGDNDIAAGRLPEQVAADVRALAGRIHSSLPQTRVVVIAIKPSIRRWELIDRMREANRLVREFSESDARVALVDIDRPMLDEAGQPRPELFVADGLHLSDEGYALWAKLVRPYLQPEAD